MLKTDITFLPGTNYPDSHHSQGGMKFATQISNLLIYNAVCTGELHMGGLHALHLSISISISNIYYSKVQKYTLKE